MGGISAIDNLIDCHSEENDTKIIRFANFLRMIFQKSPGTTDADTLIRASKALGHLARVGGTLTVDFVESEVKRALEWLQAERYEGDWSNDVRHGRGALELVNGEVYTGQWRSGQRNGHGELAASLGETYSGKWIGGVRCGPGHHEASSNGPVSK